MDNGLDKTRHMNYREFFNKRVKELNIQNYIWMEDEPLEFVYNSKEFSVNYKKTGDLFHVYLGVVLWKYKAEEIKFNE